MVTGDYHHTAIAVARGAGMIPKGSPMLIIQAQSESDSLLANLGQSPSAGERQGTLLGTACTAVEDLLPLHINSTSGSVIHQQSSDCNQVTRHLRLSAADSALVPGPAVDASQLEVVKQGVTDAYGQEHACLTFTLDSQGRSVSLDPIQALTQVAQVGPLSNACDEHIVTMLRVQQSLHAQLPHKHCKHARVASAQGLFLLTVCL